MYVAALDLGSNTIATLVQKKLDGKLTVAAEYAECTRLGEKLAQKGQLTPAAMQRTLDAASRQCQLVQRHFHPFMMTVVGTSAIRDAANGQDFLRRCQQELSLQALPAALSAEQEANLSFRGAASGFAATTMICNFDVGGASTEVSIGFPGNLLLSCSLPAGCVRWRDQFGLADIFRGREIAIASQAALVLLRPHRQSLQALLSSRPRDFSATVTGGTGTALAALLSHCDDMDASLHGCNISLPAMRDCLLRLAAMPATAALRDALACPVVVFTSPAAVTFAAGRRRRRSRAV